MADILTTLANLQGASDKGKITEELRAELDKLIKHVDAELKLSRKLHNSGSKQEAEELLDLVGRNLEIIKRLQQIVADISTRLH